MKKILKSAFVAIFALAMIGVGTSAFFSDSETSVGNTLVAGDIDLQIDNESYAIDWNIPGYNDPQGAFVASTATSWSLKDLTVEKFFDFVDLKPGDYGEDTISVHVGSNDAWVCAAAQITDDNDNTYVDPELEDDTTTGENAALSDGELDEEVNFAFWVDDGDNVYETDETIFLDGPISALGGAGQIALADSTTSILGEANPIPGGQTFYIGKYWCFGEMTATPLDPGEGSPLDRDTGFSCSGVSVDNASQTDMLVADLQFYAEQARNNGDFQCSQWTPDFPVQEERPEVGAALGGYTTPTDCSVTVTGNESIQTAVNGAADNSTVCVDNAYDGTGDNAAIRIEILGLTLAATTQGVNLDVPVVLSNSNVTVTGFDGSIGQAESPAEQAAFYLDADADGAAITFNTVTGGVGAAILTETGGALGGGLIANNVLSGATQGIYLNPHTGTIVIEYNDIDDNAAGIAGLNGATVRYNEFEHAGAAAEAIGADPSHDANPATVSFNNFLDDMRVNTYTAIAGDVSAENNFWNPNGGAAQTGGTDEVDFTPEAGAMFPHQ